MSCFTTLKKKGLRITQPRRIILGYIRDNGSHLTAEEIINFVHLEHPHINKSTIYRTLELLEENKCIFKSQSEDGTIYHHAEEGHYYHLVCRNCGKTVDCEEDIFAPVEKTLEEKHGFQLDFSHVVMSGLCEKCKKLRV